MIEFGLGFGQTPSNPASLTRGNAQRAPFCNHTLVWEELKDRHKFLRKHFHRRTPIMGQGICELTVANVLVGPTCVVCQKMIVRACLLVRDEPCQQVKGSSISGR